VTPLCIETVRACVSKSMAEKKAQHRQVFRLTDASDRPQRALP
jgi:hypothetical protein